MLSEQSSQDSGIQQLDSAATLRLTRQLGLFYSSRDDLRGNQFLDNHFGIRLVSASDCWSLDLGVTDKVNPNETEVRAQLTLVGLGSSGHSLLPNN